MASEHERRASEARERADELARRRARLEAGDPPTQDDVDRAVQGAEDSKRHDKHAHLRAGRAHRRAADAHSRAAQVAGSAGDSDRAAEHRAAAEADQRAAAVDDEAAEA